MTDLVTAAIILKKLVEQNRCDGIDNFIETTIFDALSKCDNVFQPIEVSCEVINQKGWKRNIFMQEMKLRGFGISFVSEQRDGDYYKIQIPKV